MAKLLRVLLPPTKLALYSTPNQVLNTKMVEPQLKVLRKLAGEQLYRKVVLAKVNLILSFN
jgi:hypothetical protein